MVKSLFSQKPQPLIIFPPSLSLLVVQSQPSALWQVSGLSLQQPALRTVPCLLSSLPPNDSRATEVHKGLKCLIIYNNSKSTKTNCGILLIHYFVQCAYLCAQKKFAHKLCVLQQVCYAHKFILAFVWYSCLCSFFRTRKLSE